MPVALTREMLSILASMGVVAAGAILFAVLLVITAALVWQEARRSPGTDTAVYWMPEAVEFVGSRLSPGALERLGPYGVRLVLEWGVHYHQVVAPRDEGRRPVVGSGDALDYILARGLENGSAYDPFDVAEVLAAETEYLVEIGAVGGPVEGNPT
jgi:hypothetical protein